MRDLLVRSRLFNYLAAATPGLKEMVTIGKVWELAQPDRKVKKGREYDLVIVDAPATGHGIGFLQTPRTFAGIAQVGPIHSQAKALDRFITDHETTGVAIVSLPEEMPVNESAGARAPLTQEVGRGRRPRLHERDVPGALRATRRPTKLERVLEITEGPPHAAVRAASPSTAARTPSASSCSGWTAASARRSGPCPSSSSRGSTCPALEAAGRGLA